MDISWPASRSYLILSLTLWALFLFSVALLAGGSGEGGLPPGALAAVVLLQSATVAAQFGAAYRLIAREDEFVRALTAKRIIAAAGLTVTAAVGWGSAQQFLGAPSAPTWLIYPLFWGAFGAVTPLVRTSRP